jgi:hypothetical protein
LIVMTTLFWPGGLRGWLLESTGTRVTSYYARYCKQQSRLFETVRESLMEI